MSYSTSFKLIKELDKQFTGWYTPNSSKDAFKYKNILVVICMKGIENQDSTNLHKYYSEIESSLYSLIQMHICTWKFYLDKELKENDDTASFYGWEYSKSNRNSTWESEDDIAEYFLSNLFILACQSTKSLFEDETNFWSKREWIGDLVEDIKQAVYSMLDHKFIDYYREHPDLAIEEGDDTEYEDEVEDEVIEHAEEKEECEDEVIEYTEEKEECEDEVIEYTEEKEEQVIDTTPEQSRPINLV